MRLTKILALHDSVGDGATDTLTSFLLVTVVTSTIEETVASLDSVVYSLD